MNRIGRLLVRRAIATVPVLLLVSFGVFALILAVPGDAAATLAGENATRAQVEQVRHDLGLGDPLLVQYGRWARGVVHLDLGHSLVTKRSVGRDLADNSLTTFSLAGGALVLAIVAGTIVGAVSGVRPGSWRDRGATLFATVSVSLPTFVTGILLIRVFGNQMHLLPSVGYTAPSASIIGWLRSITLPSFALGLVVAGGLARQLRSGFVDTLGADYVRTSWAWGGGPRTAIGKHAFRNALVPALAVLGTQLTWLLGGTIIVEQIFGIRGIGTYLYEGVMAHDLPVIQGVVLWFVAIQLVINLAIDVSISVVAPRVEAG